MTGVCCNWHLDGAPGADDACAAMQRALALYGGHRSDRIDLGPIALGIELAHMLPEDRFDRQPLSGADGGLYLVADARIDNRPELAEALGLSAERTAAMGDADYILAAWERWGEGALDRLKGSYAFILWDARARVLRLVRDPLGQRPLFVHRAPGRIRVASMAKGLHALPDIPRAPDVERVRDHIALLPHVGPRSFFAGIERIEPGQMLRIHGDGRTDKVDWYDRTQDRSPRFARIDDYADAFRELFDRVIADALRTPGGVASQLSAGRDSGLVTVSAAARLAQDGKRLTAYTHVPLPGAHLPPVSGRFGNEGAGAARAAAMYPNIDHVLVDCAERTVGDEFDSNFFYKEYPVLNPTNSLWDSEIARQAAASGATLLLNGQFGNMTVSVLGTQRMAELVARGQLLRWAREVAALHRNRHHGLRSLLSISIVPHLPIPVVIALRRLFGRQDYIVSEYTALRDDLAQSEAFQSHVEAMGFDTHFRAWGDVHAMRRMVLWRVDYIGQHMKGMLAATGLDSRDPTSDIRLVEFLSGVPTELFLRDGQTAWLFKQAFGDRLPADTVEARTKGLQSADWPTRMRQALPMLRTELERARHSPTAVALMDMDGLLADASAFPNNDSDLLGGERRMRYHMRLTRGLSVSHFLRKLEAGNH
ncbi:asparagine synthetase B family protein [Rhizorhabdus sp. FW153]|uniref:asparagine synthetase B family protein n=1 Tax=Rhizorhabdus sp. FW153 TaxID=3400216 RepID=UPI003CF6255E